MITGSYTIHVPLEEVKSVNYVKGLMVWIELEGGRQVNIPINLALAIAGKLKDSGDFPMDLGTKK